jgi:hypothetical protein
MSAIKQLGLWMGPADDDWEFARYVVCWLAWDLCGEPAPPWDLAGGVASKAEELLNNLAWRIVDDRRNAEIFTDLLCVSLLRLRAIAGSLGELDEEIDHHLRSR